MELTAEEVRVLGCLIEKGATTPDQYPISTNALVNAELADARDPFVANIGRASGQSQDRRALLLGDSVPDVNDASAHHVSSLADHGSSLAQRVEQLETRLAFMVQRRGQRSRSLARSLDVDVAGPIINA